MRAFILIGLALSIVMGGGSADARTTHQKHRVIHHRHKPARAKARSLHRKARAPAVTAACGGTDRWDVKDGSDAGAAHVIPKIVDGITILDLNQLDPQPIGADGRMQEERVKYRISGILRLFKHETDSDYHVVITDDPAAPYSTGHSLVIELPDPQCVSGAHQQFGASQFMPELQEAKSDFEAATRNLPNDKDLGSRNIPITVVGVLFFDFMHGQTGHSLPHESHDADRRKKVVELHPVLCADVDRYRARAGKQPC